MPTWSVEYYQFALTTEKATGLKLKDQKMESHKNNIHKIQTP